MSRLIQLTKILPFFVVLLFCLTAGAADVSPKSVALPDGAPGIGFDDLVFSPASGRVIVPGGRTGRVFFIDPATRAVDSVSGFVRSSSYSGGHEDGVTSVDEGDGFLFVIDRSDRTLTVLDAATRRLVAGVKLAGSPDYVRYVSSLHEIWITEPDLEIIESFHLTSGEKRKLVRAEKIEIPGGPESLIIDPVKGRAYTHLWAGRTVVLDLATRQPTAIWPNGCQGSRGIALDRQKGFLFVACAEGKAVVMDTKDGRILSSVTAGRGTDVIGYNPALSHLYLAGGQSATLSVVNVSAEGALTSLAEIPTAKGSHCAVADDRKQIWVCDPDAGRLLVVTDSYQR